MSMKILTGDCRDVLRDLPAASVHTCITSPPYYSLRDYHVPASVWGGLPDCDHDWGDVISINATNHTDKRRWQHTRNGRDEEQPTEKRLAWLRTNVPQGKFCQHCGAWAGCHGLEPTPDLFVAHEVMIFRAVWRVLRDDATLWLNLGDSYANDGKWGGASGGKHVSELHGKSGIGREKRTTGLKPKDLLMIPARVAMALQADGWWLRSDIIWHKPNPMPESVTDRPTSAHEHVFLLTKSARYYYDAEAIREPASAALIQQVNEGYNGHDTKDFGLGGAQSASGTKARIIANARAKIDKQRGHSRRHDGFNGRWDAMTREEQQLLGSNSRNVWTIATAPYAEAHFATFPPQLAERCIKAGTSEKGCCAACGAPWARQTEKVDTGRKQKMGDGWDTGDGAHGTIHRAGRQKGETGVPVTANVTTGWGPSCKCPAADPIPCTVLDCFSGAGTTAMVADRLGRDAIGIDLNPEYHEMAHDRLVQDAGLFAEITTK